MKYIAGDTDIEFKVKEDQYYLWMYKNNDRDIVYMKFYENVPGYCYNIKDAAFGPFRQLEKFKALGWNLEKVK